MSRLEPPVEERTYKLKSLEVPPKKYDVFLQKVLYDYKQFILEETGCDTLKEAEEKEKQRIIKLNPGNEPDDTHDYPAVVVNLYGITNPRIKNPNALEGELREKFLTL